MIVVLSHEEVEELLPMKECIEAMSDALAALARNEVHNPLRFIVKPPDTRHLLGLMPAYRGGGKAAYALKEVCVFPDNPERGLDAHQGAVLLHSAETGELLGVFNASAITAVRTAAVSAAATKLLARKNAKELAMIGTGVQAKAHLDAMSSVVDFERALVASRLTENAERFAASMASRVPFPIEPAEDVASAVRDADVVVTATNSRDPVLERAWLKPGTHINAVGSSIAAAREIDTATMAAASLFVDRRESMLNESGDYLFAAKEGVIGPDHIRAEIGELLIGQHSGRSSDDEITLFKSLGLAVEDLAAAQFLYERALDWGVGSRVRF